MAVKVAKLARHDDVERVFTYEEVAERFGVSPKQVQRWCNDGRMGYVRLPMGRRVAEHHIREFIERNNVDAVA